MKALSLTQPWASLLVLGIKRIETRSWYTGYRGPLVIHASKGGADRDLAAQYGLDADDMPLGAIVGTVTLVDCVKTEELTHLTMQEDALGDFSEGRYGWITDDARALPEPIPCKGSLGLWDVPADARAALAADEGRKEGA